MRLATHVEDSLFDDKYSSPFTARETKAPTTGRVAAVGGGGSDRGERETVEGTGCY
jgi:hypothetical protein